MAKAAKAKAKSDEDPLVAAAFDKDKHLALAEAIQDLNPSEAAFFLAKLEAALKKRKMQIVGYLVAMLLWVLGTMFGLYYFGSHSGFTGWVFLAPFAAVGIVLWGFGKWANRIGNNIKIPNDDPPPPPA